MFLTIKRIGNVVIQDKEAISIEFASYYSFLSLLSFTRRILQNQKCALMVFLEVNCYVPHQKSEYWENGLEKDKEAVLF